jgi:hypothetical protein
MNKRTLKKEDILESLNKILKERKSHYMEKYNDADVNLKDLINLTATLNYINKKVNDGITVRHDTEVIDE